MTKTTHTEPRRSADLPLETRLANRITLLTVFTAFAAVLGLTMLARNHADGPILLVAATLPLLVAIGTVPYLRRLRAELRGMSRAAGAEPPSAPPPSVPVQRAPRSTRGSSTTLRETGRSPLEESHGLER